MLAELTNDTVLEFNALRRHQKHAWHAFLVQLAVLALHRASEQEPPKDEFSWADLLRRLTPDDADDAPWTLVTPFDRPAFLQAPNPDGESKKAEVVFAPDQIDVLSIAKNHDLKSARIDRATPQDWIFALVSVQTMGGRKGRGHLQIARMNGAFGSRPSVSVTVGTRPGQRFLRDLRVLLRRRDEIVQRYGFGRSEGGLALVWLLPWDGKAQISPGELDPLCIEICRRLRLVGTDAGGVAAHLLSSTATRIAAKALNGVTGDPWAPVNAGQADKSVLSLSGAGFHYRLMSAILFSGSYIPGLLQEIDPDDPDDGLSVTAMCLAGGQGKTNGFHERTIPFTRPVVSLLRRNRALLERLAQQRIDAISTLRDKVLLKALGALRSNLVSIQKINALPVSVPLAAFDDFVDVRFFHDLWEEVAEADGKRGTVRDLWIAGLADEAYRLLERQIAALPTAAISSHRAAVVARNVFWKQLHSAFGNVRSNMRSR